jgi:hypothetical protein
MQRDGIAPEQGLVGLSINSTRYEARIDFKNKIILLNYFKRTFFFIWIVY